MKALIIYKGKYGATQQYTQWLAEELRQPVYTPESLDRDELGKCELVMIGSSVYMGRLLIRDWLKQNMMILQNKKLILYIVCATPASEAQKRGKIIHANVPSELRGHMDIFFLPGRLVIGKLSWKDRLFLRLGSMLEKDPAKKKAMQRDMDEVKRGNIAGMTKTAKAFLAGVVPAGNIERAYQIL